MIGSYPTCKCQINYYIFLLIQAFYYCDISCPLFMPPYRCIEISVLHHFLYIYESNWRKNPDKEIKIMSVTMKQFTTIYGNESTLYGNLSSLDSNRKCLLEDTGHLHVRSIYSLWRQLQIKTRVPLTISVSFLRYLSNSEWCFHSWLPNLFDKISSYGHEEDKCVFLVMCGILNINCYWGIAFQYSQSTSAKMEVQNDIFTSHRLTLIYDNQNDLFVLKSNIWELL